MSDNDSDADGLMDWEETLWGLDPLSPISNPEGIKDNDYVTNKITEAEAGGTPIRTGLNSNLLVFDSGNRTGDIGRELFAEYLSLKQDNNVSPFTINQMVDRIQQKYTPQIAGIQITTNDLTIIEDSILNMKNFGNQVAAIKQRYANIYIEDPVTNPDLLGESEGGTIEKFQRASDLYKDMYQELKKVPVPSSVVSPYVELISSYVISSEGLLEYSVLKIDPLSALFGIQKHVEATGIEEKALISIQATLKASGIIFSSNEAGNYWNTL